MKIIEFFLSAIVVVIGVVLLFAAFAGAVSLSVILARMAFGF